MTRRSAMLALRRERLLERSAQLRGELAHEGRDLALRFGVADRVLGVIRSGPVRALALGAAALALFWYPRRLVRIAGRVLLFWPLIRPFLPRLIQLWRDPPAPAP